MQIGKAHFLGIAVLHFGDPGNWQFQPLRDILQYAAHKMDQSWLALNEGTLRDVETLASPVAALKNEQDPGMLTWFMKKAGIPVASADIQARDEVKKLLYGTETVPEQFPSDFIAHHYACRNGGQLLRGLENGVDYGDYMTYTYDRLHKGGLLEAATQFNLDFSEINLRKTHKRVREESGIDLPFDPHVAFARGFTSEEWASVFFIPTNYPAETYGNNTASPFTTAQRVGSTARNIYYNEHLADLFTDHLKEGKSIIAVSGGAHIARSVEIMAKRGVITRDMPKLYRGADACMSYIGKRTQ